MYKYILHKIKGQYSAWKYVSWHCVSECAFLNALSFILMYIKICERITRSVCDHMDFFCSRNVFVMWLWQQQKKAFTITCVFVVNGKRTQDQKGFLFHAAHSTAQHRTKRLREEMLENKIQWLLAESRRKCRTDERGLLPPLFLSATSWQPYP